MAAPRPHFISPSPGSSTPNTDFASLSVGLQEGPSSAPSDAHNPKTQYSNYSVAAESVTTQVAGAVSNKLFSKEGLASLGKQELFDLAVKNIPEFLLENFAQLLSCGDLLEHLEKAQEAYALLLKKPLSADQRREIFDRQKTLSNRLNEKRCHFIESEIVNLYQTIAAQISSGGNYNYHVQQFEKKVVPQIKKLPAAQRLVYWKKIILTSYEVGDEKTAQLIFVSACRDIKTYRRGGQALRNITELVMSLQGHANAKNLPKFFRNTQPRDKDAQQLWSGLSDLPSERLEELVTLKIYYENLGDKNSTEDQEQLTSIYQQIKKLQLELKEKRAQVDYSQWVSSGEALALESPYEELNYSQQNINAIDPIREQVEIAQVLVRADMALLDEPRQETSRQGKHRVREWVANVEQMREDTLFAEELSAQQGEDLSEWVNSYALAGQALLYYQSEVSVKPDFQYEQGLIREEIKATQKQAQVFFQKAAFQKASQRSEQELTPQSGLSQQEWHQASADLAFRYRRALAEEDLLWLAKLNSESTISFFEASILAHQYQNNARRSFGPLVNLGYLHAYAQFSSLGLSDHATELVREMELELEQKYKLFNRHVYTPNEMIYPELQGDYFGRLQSNVEAYWSSYQSKIVYQDFLYEEYVPQMLVLESLYRQEGAEQQADAILGRLSILEGLPDSLRSSPWGVLLGEDSSSRDIRTMAEGLMLMREAKLYLAEQKLAESQHPMAQVQRAELRRQRAQRAVALLSAISNEYLDRHRAEVVSDLTQGEQSHYRIANHLAWAALVDHYVAHPEKDFLEAFADIAKDPEYKNFIPGAYWGENKEAVYLNGERFDDNLGPQVWKLLNTLEGPEADELAYADQVISFAERLEETGYLSSAVSLYKSLLDFPDLKIQRKAQRRIEGLPSHLASQELVSMAYTAAELSLFLPQARLLAAVPLVADALFFSGSGVGHSGSGFSEELLSKAELFVPLAIGTKTASMATRYYKAWLRAHRGAATLPAMMATGAEVPFYQSPSFVKLGESFVHNAFMAGGTVPSQAVFAAWRKNSTSPFEAEHLGKETLAFAIDLGLADLARFALSALQRRIDDRIGVLITSAINSPHDQKVLGELKQLKKLKQQMGHLSTAVGFTGGGYLNEATGLRDPGNLGLGLRFSSNYLLGRMMGIAGGVNHLLERAIAPRFKRYEARMKELGVDPSTSSGAILLSRFEMLYQNGVSLSEILNPEKINAQGIRDLLQKNFGEDADLLFADVLVYSMIPRKVGRSSELTVDSFRDPVDGQYYRRVSQEEILRFASRLYCEVQLNKHLDTINGYEALLDVMGEEFHHVFTKLLDQLDTLRWLVGRYDRDADGQIAQLSVEIRRTQAKIKRLIAEVDPNLAKRVIEAKVSEDVVLFAHFFTEGDDAKEIPFPEMASSAKQGDPYRGPITVALALLGISSLVGAENTVGMLGVWGFLGTLFKKKSQELSELPLRDIPERVYIFNGKNEKLSHALLTAHLSYLLGRMLKQRGQSDLQVKDQLQSKAADIAKAAEFILKGIQMYGWDRDTVIRDLFRELVNYADAVNNVHDFNNQVYLFLSHRLSSVEGAFRHKDTQLHTMEQDAAIISWASQVASDLKIGRRINADTLSGLIVKDLKKQGLISFEATKENGSEQASALGTISTGHRVAVTSHVKPRILANNHDYALVLELSIQGKKASLLIEGDGVGTQDPSYRAARIAVWAVARYVHAHADKTDDVSALLRDAIVAAKELLTEKGLQTSLGDSTLAVAAIVEHDGGRRLYSAQIGSDQIAVYRPKEKDKGAERIYASKVQPASGYATQSIGANDYRAPIELHAPRELGEQDFVVISSDGDPFAPEQVGRWVYEASSTEDPVAWLGAKLSYIDSTLKKWSRNDADRERGIQRQIKSNEELREDLANNEIFQLLNSPRTEVTIAGKKYYLAPNGHLYDEARAPKSPVAASNEASRSIDRALQEIADETQQNDLREVLLLALATLQTQISSEQRQRIAERQQGLSASHEKAYGYDVPVVLNPHEALKLGAGGVIFREGPSGREPRAKLRNDDTTFVIWGPKASTKNPSEKIDYNQPGIKPPAPDPEIFPSDLEFESGKQTLVSHFQAQLTRLMQEVVLGQGTITEWTDPEMKTSFHLRSLMPDPSNPSLLNVAAEFAYSPQAASAHLRGDRENYYFALNFAVDLNSKQVSSWNVQYQGKPEIKAHSKAQAYREILQDISALVGKSLAEFPAMAGDVFLAVTEGKTEANLAKLANAATGQPTRMVEGTLSKVLLGDYHFVKMYLNPMGNIIKFELVSAANRKGEVEKSYFNSLRPAINEINAIVVHGLLYKGKLVRIYSKQNIKTNDVVDINLGAMLDASSRDLPANLLTGERELIFSYSLASAVRAELAKMPLETLSETQNISFEIFQKSDGEYYFKKLTTQVGVFRDSGEEGVLLGRMNWKITPNGPTAHYHLSSEVVSDRGSLVQALAAIYSQVNWGQQRQFKQDHLQRRER